MSSSIEFTLANDDIWEKVAKKFGTTLKALDEDVATIQTWIKSQPHLPDILDGHVLRNLLIMSKLSVEVVKERVNNFYTLRIKFREDYGKIHPKLEFHKIFCSSSYMVVYPKLTPDFYRITYIKVKNPSLIDTLEQLQMIKRAIVTADLRTKKDVMVGEIIVTDFKSSPASLFRKQDPILLYKTMVIYQKLSSSPLKAVYFLNFPPVASIFLSILKKIMKPKLFSRIQVLEDEAMIKDFIPEELLPEDFGGKGPTLEALQEEMNRQFEEISDYFDSLDEMVVNESLRPEKMNNDEVLGFYGNFKKLDID